MPLPRREPGPFETDLGRSRRGRVPVEGEASRSWWPAKRPTLPKDGCRPALLNARGVPWKRVAVSEVRERLWTHIRAAAGP